MTPFAHLNKKFDLIVIGCSVGGIEALRTILSDLPNPFSAAIAVVQHRSHDSNSMMIRYFSEICNLPVLEPDDKEPIQPGQIYFAPANYHMLVAADKRFNLSMDEPVYFSRPSIDVLFNSAADIYHGKLLGIVMSGANGDGSTGLKEIKRLGGFTVAQDAETAFQPEMPRAAIEIAKPDLILSLQQIKELLYAVS